MENWVYLPDSGISVNLALYETIIWNNKAKDGSYSTMLIVDSSSDTVVLLSGAADRLTMRNKFFTNPEDCPIETQSGVIMLVTM